MRQHDGALPISSPRLIEPLEQRIALTALPAGFGQVVIASNIGSTTAVDALPDGRILLATQAGALRIVQDGKLLAKPVLTLKVDSAGERGLIGVTHDPNFTSNHFIYVYHTVPATQTTPAYNEVSRFTLDGNIAPLSSEVDILQLNPLSSLHTNHNGGAMHFGTDGMLYIGVGENAIVDNSQTLGNLLGKVLRINVANIEPGDPINDVAKLIPSNNPFVGTAQGINQAIYALGFRNPFTFAVNPINGETFIDDVGENTWEEIDKLVPGGNYGWHHTEGFATKLPVTGLGPGVYQDPQMSYNHHGGPAGGGNAIIGGVFYEPPAVATDPFPSLYTGKYFYSDFGHDWMRVFNPHDPGTLANPDTSTKFDTDTAAQPTGMILGTDGSIYYAAQANGGELVKVFAEDKTAITVQPQMDNVSAGATAQFSGQAVGVGTLRYQWQVNSGAGDSFVNIPGATGATFSTQNTGQDSPYAGKSFRLVVIANGKRATSKPATLTILS
jgi:glucose/arabinose dehydrogenase